MSTPIDLENHLDDLSFADVAWYAAEDAGWSPTTLVGVIVDFMEHQGTDETPEFVDWLRNEHNVHLHDAVPAEDPESEECKICGTHIEWVGDGKWVHTDA